MKAKLFLFTMMLTTALTAFMSCTEDIDANNHATAGSLKITVRSDNDSPDGGTRTSYSGFVTTFTDGDQIGVYAVKGTTALFSNICFTYDADGDEWTTTGNIEYNSDYTYFAYYPYTSTPYTPDFTQATVNNKFSLFLTDASNKFHRADQSTLANYQASDLMIAQGVDAGSSTVTFTMLHKKGLAVFNGEGAAEATFTGNIPYLLSSTKYFLMKPSTSTSFTDDDGTYSLSASAGRYVTHSIAESYNTFVLSVTGPTAYTYSGGTKSYSITSYKQNSSGTKSKAAAWTATYDTDGDGVFDDSKPSWLTTFTASGDGSTSATNYSATVSAQSAMSPTSASASSILAAATQVGSSSDYYDLSTNGGTTSMTTANCYMVHAPGYYKLPLVYGNAIKNGTTNTSAYNPSGTSSATFLKPFLNHAGSGITNPYLKNNSATPDGATLIWQDAAGLIKKNSLAIDGDYLKFQIPSDAIAEGNAVIAATKSGTVVWSWHIWVTPQTYSSLTTVNGYSVAPSALGWVNSGSVTKSGYEGRSCIVKISQAGGQEETFTVTQSPNITVSTTNGGYAPYYQWGRKDPEIPSTGTGNTNHAAYDIDGNNNKSITQKTYTSTGSTADYGTIANGIQYPLYHYYNNINGNTGRYGPFQSWEYNLWDAACTAANSNRTNHTVKTIYDPCPPGFCVPSSGFIYYITTTVNSSTWDGTTNAAGRLWNSTLFFPAAGCRRSSSGATPGGVGSFGYFWSATPNSEQYGYYLGFYSSYWNESNVYRATGFSVRPVAE